MMDAVAGAFGIGGIGFLLDGARDIWRNENRSAALKFSVGIGSLAIGAALLYKVSEVAQCPIDELGDLLSTESQSTTKHYFTILNETQGVTCENYFPWGEQNWPNGQATSITSGDLQRAVSWGIGVAKRPFIALKYGCENGYNSSVTLFQGYQTTDAFYAYDPHFSNWTKSPCFPFAKSLGSEHLGLFKDLLTNGTADFTSAFGLSETISLS